MLSFDVLLLGAHRATSTASASLWDTNLTLGVAIHLPIAPGIVGWRYVHEGRYELIPVDVPRLAVSGGPLSIFCLVSIKGWLDGISSYLT